MCEISWYMPKIDRSPSGQSMTWFMTYCWSCPWLPSRLREACRLRWQIHFDTRWKRMLYHLGWERFLEWTFCWRACWNDYSIFMRNEIEWWKKSLELWSGTNLQSTRDSEDPKRGGKIALTAPRVMVTILFVSSHIFKRYPIRSKHDEINLWCYARKINNEELDKQIFDLTVSSEWDHFPSPPSFCVSCF